MTSWSLFVVNLGTPDGPDVPAVRRYLREFLSDPRVLDINPVLRSFILNAFILPFRPRQSAEAYQKIWTDRGSPLLYHGEDLVNKLRARLGVQVEFGMRYQNPSIGSALKKLRDGGAERIVVLPLFPQYSSAAWGSAVEKIFAEANQLWNVPYLQVVAPYYDHPGFLDAFAAVARPVLDDLRPDKVLMSFHGLPERHVVKSDESGGRHCLQSDGCCDAIVSANRHCYRAQCYATARGIAQRLGLAGDDGMVCFQSRLGRDPWIRPYTDEIIIDFAKQGVQRVAVLSPAFVADCLETLEEIGIRASADFQAHGGDELRLVPSLNSTDAWVDGIVDILQDNVGIDDEKPSPATV